jgi:hypothetical protein
MDVLLEQLDERIRRISEEVFQQLSVKDDGLGDGWLSYAQIVELTGLSEWTIGEAVRRGELEADYPLPRCPRVKRSKLREWMERNNKERDGAGVPDRRRA